MVYRQQPTNYKVNKTQAISMQTFNETRTYQRSKARNPFHLTLKTLSLNLTFKIVFI